MRGKIVVSFGDETDGMVVSLMRLAGVATRDG
jgi:hypothetical protein